MWHGTYSRSAKSSFAPFQAEIAVLMCQPVVDPDFQITGGGGGGGGRDPDPEIRGGAVGGLHKQFFRPFGPQFGLKLRGGGALPWIPYCRTEALSDVVRVPAQKLSSIV